MMIKIDFESSDAFYIQLRDQIVVGIAKDVIKEGDSLPSVRQMAELVGVNMHTVNKAYSVLRQEGFIKVDRRRGAIISIDVNKLRAMEESSKELRYVLTRAICRGISKEEAIALVEEIYESF